MIILCIIFAWLHLFKFNVYPQTTISPINTYVYLYTLFIFSDTHLILNTAWTPIYWNIRPRKKSFCLAFPGFENLIGRRNYFFILQIFLHTYLKVLPGFRWISFISCQNSHWHWIHLGSRTLYMCKYASPVFKTVYKCVTFMRKVQDDYQQTVRAHVISVQRRKLTLKKIIKKI